MIMKALMTATGLCHEHYSGYPPRRKRLATNIDCGVGFDFDVDFDFDGDADIDVDVDRNGFDFDFDDDFDSEEHGFDTGGVWVPSADVAALDSKEKVLVRVRVHIHDGDCRWRSCW